MQQSRRVIPFAKPERERHNDAFNSQGRSWKGKHVFRNGSVVKVRPKRQHYNVEFETTHYYIVDYFDESGNQLDEPIVLLDEWVVEPRPRKRA